MNIYCSKTGKMATKTRRKSKHLINGEALRGRGKAKGNLELLVRVKPNIWFSFVKPEVTVSSASLRLSVKGIRL